MKVIEEIIKVTASAGPDDIEVNITQIVAENMKKKKTGLFQNEIDYRILFPNFDPTSHEGKSSQKFRADLVGFDSTGFSFVEFKMFDENKIKKKNIWGVFWLSYLDLLKLEAAVLSNVNNLEGTAAIIFAIRNTDFQERNNQSAKMVEVFLKDNFDKKPSIKGATYFPILSALKEYSKKKNKFQWIFEIKKKKNVAFLVGKLDLQSASG